MTADLLVPQIAHVVTAILPNPHEARLSTLGVRRGATIQLIRKTTSGGILFRVEDHRVVIHKSVAQKIEVK